MNISIIIPNYNGQELLRRNLSKVLDATTAYKDGIAEIIIVDDASQDGSVEYIKNTYPKLKIIRNEKNLGFSSTINRGVEEAKGEIVVLLNTDVAPQKDFLNPLISHFDDSNIFAVGCLDKSIEGRKIVLRGRGIGKFQRGFLIHRRGEVDKTDTLWVSGGSGAFRKKTWEKLGGFDSLYNPFYWEDIDLSYRALKSGHKIFFEPKAVVVHEHAYGAIKHYQPDFKIKIIAYRNQFIFVWKNITDLNKRLWHLLWLPYHVVRAFMRGDLYFLIGFFLALIRLPAIIKEGLRVRKLFIKSDNEVLS